MIRRKFYFATVVVLLLGWIVYALAGASIAQRIAARYGEKLLNLCQNKFNDPALFVQHRLREGLYLATLVLAWVAIHAALNYLLRIRPSRLKYSWVAHALAGFVLLNIWLAAAMNTALFWGVMGIGGGVQNQIQFHFKRIMLEENQTPLRAVLVGNSQTRAQIDEDELNSILGTNLWTTELHFPGSHGYDLLLIDRQIRRANPQIVVCYLSEGYFYQGSQSPTPAAFLGISDLPEMFHLGAEHYLSGDEIRYGLLGDLLPLFRCRDIFAHRLFGSATAALKQHQYDTALESDLEARGREEAGSLRLSTESDFQKRAFEEFAAHCQSAHHRLILLEGGYNPALDRHLDPALRVDMRNFLRDLQKRYPVVTVVPRESLPEQKQSDYEDLSHVNKETQNRFTLFLAGFLSSSPATRTE